MLRCKKCGNERLFYKIVTFGGKGEYYYNNRGTVEGVDNGDMYQNVYSKETRIITVLTVIRS